jgi:ArsR family transcriptional regulator
MTSSRQPKQTLLAAFAAVARALGSPHRLQLIEQLAQGERSVEALASKTGLSVANASQHLQALRRAGLVEGRREGRQIIYHVSADSVLGLVGALQRVAEHQVEAVRVLHETYFQDRDRLEPVSLVELRRRLEDGLVTVLDVRPADEFAAGHVPGAVNMPMSELAGRLSELPSGKPVVAYCRGPLCVLAFEAVALLRINGFEARRLEGGLPEWRLGGFDIAH